MSRKSKYSAEQKLAILNELIRSNISEVAKKYAVGKKLLELGGIYINIRALMAYDLLTIIIDIQRNLNYLYFKAGLKRVTNCMTNHGIRANIRKKKHNRVKRHEEYINDNLLEDNLIAKDQMKFG